MLRRRMRSERGAVIVEFALVVPILIVLVMGIAEFGHAFFAHATMAGAAREGVRAMALGTGSPSTVAHNTLDPAGLGGAAVGTGSACPATAPAPPAVPPNATVTITYSLPSLTGMFGPFNLSATGVMRCNG